MKERQIKSVTVQ